MKIIIMIPARAGSKRIPKKNFRYLKGKPLLQYPIDLSKEIFDANDVVVNSESADLGKLAESLGVRFHQRPDELGGDKATNQDFTQEFLLHNECDYVVMINTTSPLLSLETLKGFIEAVKEDKYDTVLSVVAEQAETFFEEKPLNFSLEKKINSQNLPVTEKVVWALTAWRRSTFLEVSGQGGCGVFGGKVGTYAIPKDECCDLDTPEDWRIAEGFLESRAIKGEEPKYWEA